MEKDSKKLDIEKRYEKSNSVALDRKIRYVMIQKNYSSRKVQMEMIMRSLGV